MSSTAATAPAYKQRMVRRNRSSSPSSLLRNISDHSMSMSSNGTRLTSVRHKLTRSSTSIRDNQTVAPLTGHAPSSRSKFITAAYQGRSILSVIALVMIVLYFVATIRYSRDIVITQSAMEEQRKQSTKVTTVPLPGFDTVLQRAQQNTQLCTKLQPDRAFDTRSILPFHNDTVASLPSFGIINAIQSYNDKKNKNDRELDTTTTTTTATERRTTIEGNGDDDESVWPICQLPPTTSCDETQLSVVIMAYNPDRLGYTLSEIQRMFDPEIFHNLVKEVILVWNGERQIDESDDGKKFLEYMTSHPIRIVYPLTMGFPNDLMNRYHPHIVQPTTKALLYYDDDGPFYSHQAIQGGFELWKRHSRAQIGTMARQITYSQRQQEYKVSLLGTESLKKTNPADDVFVPHCTNVDDEVDYEFHFFANYDANMVLPSGSMLHSNYLCYLWHPIFDEVRKFVLLHPVHPDDMTVSLIVSQLAGVAPRVYSRRLDLLPQNQKRRRLTGQASWNGTDENYPIENSNFDEPMDMGIVPLSEQQRHRSLMFSICWDCAEGMTAMKVYWAELRTEAVNALVRYFGSINSGSIGWCAKDSKYYNVKKDGRCWPVMAKQGMLPWMNSDGSPKKTCL